MSTAQLLHGDCLEEMKKLAPNSVDAIVTDPPYGLSFMGKRWDHGVPSVQVWREALRVLKPGGYLASFGGTRTYHRLVCAIEDAGFEIRDQIGWAFGSGFPKSHDVSKAIDKAAGAEREVVGPPPYTRGRATQSYSDTRRVSHDYPPQPITAPTTDAARQWQGWGTALKPAWEPIVLARKPLSEGTVAANVLRHGTGALNIDGCRVPGAKPDTTRGASAKASSMVGTLGAQGRILDDGSGRWPANLIHDGSDEVVAAFPETSSGALNQASVQADNKIYGQHNGYSDPKLYQPNTGSAARFFYCAKASKKDRDAGLEGMPEVRAKATSWSGDGMSERRDARPGRTNQERPEPLKRNTHPTVKPTALMAYLCRLVTPPGGTVLDPFMGSGSTGRGAKAEGFNFIGIEREVDYLAIAERRIAESQPSLFEAA